MMRLALTLALVLAPSLAACKNDSPSAGSGFASATPPVPGPHEPAAVAPGPAAPAGSGPVEKIFAQMEKEKTSRTGAKPTVEEVLAAIGKAGVTFDESKQVVAKTAGARYCVLSQDDKSGLKVVVCEYSSAEEAKRLEQVLIEKYQKLAPTRTFVLKGSTSVQIVDREDSPLPDARRRIDEALATL